MSKFAQALQAKQALSQQSEAQEVQPTPAVEIDARPPAAEMRAVEPAKESVSKGQTGKRSSADYHQVNVYLKKETWNQAKIALLQSNDERDFSELIEDLLSGWVKEQKAKK